MTAINIRVKAGLLLRSVHTRQARPRRCTGGGPKAAHPLSSTHSASAALRPSQGNAGVSHGQRDRSHPHTGGAVPGAGAAGAVGSAVKPPQSSRAAPSPELRNTTALLVTPCTPGTVTGARPGAGRRPRAAAAVQEACGSTELATP